jgi:glucose/mannose-6-phosphate isomerase
MPQDNPLAATGLLQHVTGFPAAMRTAWTEAQRFACELPADSRAIVVSGMGGSASAGDLTAALAALSGHAVPVVPVASYRLPGWVGQQHLVIAVSYSGDTEETLAVFEQAATAGAQLAAVTAGGELWRRALANHVPAFRIAYEAPPRHSLAWTLPPLLAAAHRCGAFPGLPAEIEAAAGFLEAEVRSPEFLGLAHRIAQTCAGRVTVFYGGEHLAPVARRWKNQCNENAKHLAFADELPGGNHNSIMGLDFPGTPLAIVMLESERFASGLLARAQASREVMAGPSLVFREVPVRGPSLLVETLWASLLGDAVSLWLSLLNGVEALPIGRITALKERLAARHP